MCHPETRIAVQNEIVDWMVHESEGGDPQRILWLSGPAGSGKTAIAGSVAEMCEEKGLLAATFFFSSYSGLANRHSKRYLVPTLAYQLIQADESVGLGERVMAAIQRDPAVFDKRVKTQFDQLILKPLRTAYGGALASPKIIIIDGVDEVQAERSRDLPEHEARLANEADQLDILSLLLQAANDPAFPFRILVISRPERVIREFFTTSPSGVIKHMFLDNKYDPDADISLYLNAKFAEIRRRYHLPPSWPSKDIIEALVMKASGQFIYAATVIRFIQCRTRPPQVQLEHVLNLRQEDAGGNPFATLDVLYTHILNSSPDPKLAAMWIVTFTSRLTSFPAIFLRQLVEDYPGHAGYLLENLASLVQIPDRDDHLSSYKLYHKSLLDFLADSRRCPPVLGTTTWEHWIKFFLARCITVLKSEGRIPVCFLDYSIQSDSQISHLP